jgi:hypothetical protein
MTASWKGGIGTWAIQRGEFVHDRWEGERGTHGKAGEEHGLYQGGRDTTDGKMGKELGLYI